MTPARRTILACLLISILPGPAPGAGTDEKERWKRLPAEKRAEIRRLYDRLQQVPPDVRKRVLDRLRTMDPGRRSETLRKARRDDGRASIEAESRRLRRELIRGHLARLPAPRREKLLRMPPAERRLEIEKELAGKRARTISRLPPQLRESVEKMAPAEQVRFLRRMRGERVFQETFPDREEISRIRALPPRAVLRALRASEKPEFLSPGTWQRWMKLKPYERQRALEHLIER